MKAAVFIFATTHEVMAAEKLATARGFSTEVIPEPPGRTGRCGIALRLETSDAERFKAVLTAEGFKEYSLEYR